MKRNIIALFIVTTCICGVTLGQPRKAIIVNGSYEHTRIGFGTVAVGQLFTLSVCGLDLPLTTEITAQQFPLPTTLAGISLWVDDSRLAPLFSLKPLSDGEIIQITCQIPYEANELSPFHFISILKNGDTVVTSRINLLSALPHILRPCDNLFAYSQTDSCDDPLVYHLDGNLVTKGSPAKAKEFVVMYAVGMGRPNVSIKSGEPASGLAPVTAFTDFYFGVNAKPRAHAEMDGSTLQKPLYAGLLPGLVGLYQINIQIPSLPSGLPTCDAAIQSNLTISVGVKSFPLGSTIAFDGVGICVAP